MLRISLAVGVFLVSVVVAARYVGSELFFPKKIQQNLSLERVAVQGHRYLSSSEVLEHTGIELPSAAWSIRPLRVAKRLESHPLIERALVAWQEFPRTLKVVITEVRPVYVLSVDDVPSELISSRGTRIAAVDALRQPALIMEASFLPRVAASVGVSEKFEREQLAMAVQTLTSELPELESSMFRYLGNEQLQVVPADVDFPELMLSTSRLAQDPSMLGVVREVLRDIRARGESAQEIDLRFRNQVVVR